MENHDDMIGKRVTVRPVTKRSRNCELYFGTVRGWRLNALGLGSVEYLVERDSGFSRYVTRGFCTVTQ